MYHENTIKEIPSMWPCGLVPLERHDSLHGRLSLLRLCIVCEWLESTELRHAHQPAPHCGDVPVFRCLNGPHMEAEGLEGVIFAVQALQDTKSKHVR